MQKREKEHSAALLFGDLLSSMRVMMRLGNQARGRGDPYGPVTLRFIRAVQREVDIFTRNRETLVDLRDPSIRAAISVLVARLSFSLDGIMDATTEIAALQHALNASNIGDAARAEAQQSVATLKETRHACVRFCR